MSKAAGVSPHPEKTSRFDSESNSRYDFIVDSNRLESRVDKGQPHSNQPSVQRLKSADVAYLHMLHRCE
jgi:hypothetical protein